MSPREPHSASVEACGERDMLSIAPMSLALSQTERSRSMTHCDFVGRGSAEGSGSASSARRTTRSSLGAPLASRTASATSGPPSASQSTSTVPKLAAMSLRLRLNGLGKSASVSSIPAALTSLSRTPTGIFSDMTCVSPLLVTSIALYGTPPHPAPHSDTTPWCTSPLRMTTPGTVPSSDSSRPLAAGQLLQPSTVNPVMALMSLTGGYHAAASSSTCMDEPTRWICAVLPRSSRSSHAHCSSPRTSPPLPCASLKVRVSSRRSLTRLPGGPKSRDENTPRRDLISDPSGSPRKSRNRRCASALELSLWSAAPPSFTP
mmetsp:Transcript_11272/g.39181  ORF Transcript_11272/g.39181 Transcript_11272/m.39181 type:complete len:318 (-) Transcript_11272:136-1089(-)